MQTSEGARRLGRAGRTLRALGWAIFHFHSSKTLNEKTKPEEQCSGYSLPLSIHRC